MSFREIDDILWKSIEPYLPPQKPYTGRPRANMRKLMNGIIQNDQRISQAWTSSSLI